MAKKRNKAEIDWTDDEEEIIWVSKSEIKRDSEQLKKLGAELVGLTLQNLEKIPLDEDLKYAVRQAQGFKLEARRRQIQYIGKLLRNREHEPIQEALDKVKNRHNRQQALLHKLELMRDQLLDTGDVALTQIMEEYPQLDRQHLRSLIRGAQKERAADKPAKNYREIFQYLKAEIIE